MASKKNKARSARDLNPRKFKKKTSVLVIEKVEYIDYKDVDLLQRFMSDRAKIKNRRVAGNTLQQQRESRQRRQGRSRDGVAAVREARRVHPHRRPWPRRRP